MGRRKADYKRRSIKRKMKRMRPLKKGKLNTINDSNKEESSCSKDSASPTTPVEVTIANQYSPTSFDKTLENTSTNECFLMPYPETPLIPTLDVDPLDTPLFDSKDTEITSNRLEGRRIVDIAALFDQITILASHSPFSCSWEDMEFSNERRFGLKSVFIFKCRMCNKIEEIFSEDGTSGINEAAVLGALSGGGGYSFLNDMCSHMDIPCMSEKMFDEYHRGKIPDDVENYIRLKLMGEGKVRMKKGVVPHKNLPGPISLREELNARKSVVQNQKKEIRQTNVEHPETVDGCQTSKKRSTPVTDKKQNNEEFIRQMNVKRLKKIDDELNSVKCSVQNVSDNKVILEISDPNNILSNLHGLTDQYSAVIEQVIDKNDVKTHIVLCKKDTSEQMDNKTKLQETDNNETVLPDVGQESIENECTLNSETDICEVKIKMEESVTDVMNIKHETEDGEEFLPHIEREQVDVRPFKQDEDVNEKEIKNNESGETDAIQIKVEAKEDCDGPCLSYVKQEFTECVWISKTSL